MNVETFFDALAKIGDEPSRIQQLRQVVVALAITGKLDPASGTFRTGDIAAAIEETRARLVELRVVPKPKMFAPVKLEQLPKGFEDASRFAPLGSVARIDKGLTGIKQAKPGPFPLVVTGVERASCDHSDFDGAAAIIPLVSSTGHGHASIHRLHYQEGAFALGTILAAVMPYEPALISARFLFEYLSAFKDELLVSRMTGTANVTLSVGRIAEVPVPLIDPAIQAKVDDLMALLDQLESARSTREAVRDRLAASSLARLGAPDLGTFQEDGRSALALLHTLTTRPDQIKAVRQTVLNLAVRGELVERNPTDEPASELLKRIAMAKVELKKKTGDARIRIAPDPLPDELDMPLPPGWAVQSFENTFLFIDYRGNTPPKTDDGIPLITAKNIRMGHLNREPREYISKATFKTWMTRGFPEIGDLFFTTEAPLANICLNNIEEPFALAQRAICFHPYAKIDTKFVMFALMSDVMQSMIDKHATGMTAKGIKAANLKPLPIPIPPLAEQHRIVAKVDDLLDLCDRLEAGLAAADIARGRLLAALLHEALTPPPIAKAA